MATDPANHTHVSGAVAIKGDVETEMQVFDSLGPLTRKALREVPLRYSAADVWREIASKIGDPCRPDVDQFTANAIRAHCKGLLASEHNSITRK
jgi:hypothetical protein